MTVVRNFSFAGGAISPSLHARPDLVKYSTGVRTLRNFIIQRQGGAANRPGTNFIAFTQDPTAKVKLVPWVFNDAQTFILVFSALKMRVIKNGIQLNEAAQAITAGGITQASPGVVNLTGHGYLAGDQILIRDVVGMTEINERWLTVAAPVNANDFALNDLYGNAFDTTGFTAYVSGGTCEKVFEIATPYAQGDLADLRFAQSADFMTIVHQSHYPRELERLTDTSWQFLRVRFFPRNIFPPNTIALAGVGAGALNISYIVTAVNSESGEESPAGTSNPVAINVITNASPAVVTTGSPHVFINGDTVRIAIDQITLPTIGMVEVGDRTFEVAAAATPLLTLANEDATSYGTYGIGTGNIQKVGESDPAAALPTVGVPITVTWLDPNFTAGRNPTYNIYRRDQIDGSYGFVGSSNGLTFIDTGFTPDLSLQPPVEIHPHFKASKFPATVGYYQQRLLYGNTTDNPESVFASVTGSFNSFYRSIPGKDSDGIIFSLAGRKVNQVQHIIDLGDLVILTEGAEWRILGNDAGILTPTGVNSRATSHYGASGLLPAQIGSSAVYAQRRGSVIRDLNLSIETEGFRGNELSIMAQHLFDDFTLTDSAFQQIPHSIFWAVRSDGKLLGLTYIQEHAIWGWHIHDFEDGTVENISVIPNGNEDALYVVVKRTINSLETRHIERLTTRQLLDIEDATFMDTHLTFDGRNGFGTAFTMTLTGGPPWGPTDPPLTLTSSGSFFVAADVGNQIRLRTATDVVRCTIVGFTSATVVTVRPHKDVPVAFQGVAIAAAFWDYAVDQVGGLHHLEGENVSIFADGFVISNPNNPRYNIIPVTAGIATLAKPRAVIHTGLPYTSDLETLDIDTPQGETMIDKKKLITEAILFVEEARGLFVGPGDPGTDAVPKVKDGGSLYEAKLRDNENYENPVALKSGVVEVPIRSEWNDHGRVFVRQSDPVPASILSVAPAGYIPFRR